MAFSQSSDKDSSSDPKQEYTGPSILSRDKSLVGERGGKLIDFRVYANLTGIYDSGLTPVSTDQNGKLVDVGANYGMEVGYGVTGSRRWRRDTLSVDYHGSYRHYTTNSSFDGIDQFMNLRYGRVLTRHITFDFQETGGITSLGNGAYTYVPLTNNDLITVPTNELFDNRTMYNQSRLGIIWQKTARLSFGFSGEGYLVRRRSSSLAGLNGETARGDISYRITRRQTATIGYTFSHYDFQRTFGDSYIHNFSLGYGLGLGRRYDFGISGGASYVNVRGLQTVNVDPAIVAIIGQATVTQNFNRIVIVPSGDIRLVRRFQRSSIQVNASTGISPGNGVYLTSRQNAAGINYSFSGLRRWSMGASLTYNELSTIGQSIGKYKGYQGGFGATYKIASYLHAQFRYDYRHYTTQNDIFRKDSNRISLGLAFSPGERPLSLW